MASNLTKTASIFETILPIECSILSTLRDRTVNSSYETLCAGPDREDLEWLASSSLSSALSSLKLTRLVDRRALSGRCILSRSSYSLLRAAFKKLK